MSTDPCLDAALRAIRPSILRCAWNWYKRVTGYEKAMLQRRTGLKIRSTYPPDFPASTPPTFPKKDLLKGII